MSHEPGSIPVWGVCASSQWPFLTHFLGQHGFTWPSSWRGQPGKLLVPHCTVNGLKPGTGAAVPVGAIVGAYVSVVGA